MEPWSANSIGLCVCRARAAHCWRVDWPTTRRLEPGARWRCRTLYSFQIGLTSDDSGRGTGPHHCHLHPNVKDSYAASNNNSSTNAAGISLSFGYARVEDCHVDGNDLGFNGFNSAPGSLIIKGSSVLSAATNYTGYTGFGVSSLGAVISSPPSNVSTNNPWAYFAF